MIVKTEYCSTCSNEIKTYGRNMPKGDLHALVALRRLCDRGRCWVHVKDLPISRGKNLHTFRHWDLIERRMREDGACWSGYWRITNAGRAFIDGRLKVQERWLDRLGECVGLAGDLISIRSVWTGAGFNYAELVEYQDPSPTYRLTPEQGDLFR